MAELAWLLLLAGPFLVAIVSLLIPRRWLVAYTVALGYLLGLLWIDEARAQCSSCGGPFAGIGQAVIILATAGSAVALVVRFALIARSPAKDQELFEAALPTAFGFVLVAWVPAALFVLLAVALGQGMDSPMTAHALALLVAVGWFAALTRILPAGLTGRNYWLHRLQLMRTSGAVAMAGTVVWSLAIASDVVQAGEAVAQGEPYCLQVSGPGDARPARDLFDLTGFSMQAHGASVRHARLAMGDPAHPQWFNWSYRLGRFDSDNMIGGVARCEPRLHHAITLSWFGGRPTVAANAPQSGAGS
jgi:hypothetical protein